MRTPDESRVAMFTYLQPEQRVPKDHPLREVLALVNPILKRLSSSFDQLYSPFGRGSIPPERLLRALLLQIFFSIRSERQLMEQLDYNILFRWFVGMDLDEPVWHHTVFSHNRDRLLQGDIAREFFVEVRRLAQRHDLMSREHFTVDGTMLEAWASQKSFQPKDEQSPPPPSRGRNADSDFRGQQRKNQTHQSTTDPDARMFCKGSGKAAQLCYMQHVLTENRNGLIVEVETTQATGTAEREAALDMLDRLKGTHRITLGADKGYDAREFHQELRDRHVTPHIARRQRSSLDERTTRHNGYRVSQRKRKRVEEVFGWEKTVGLARKLKHRGLEKVRQVSTFMAAAYNLVRIPRLLGQVG